MSSLARTDHGCESDNISYHKPFLRSAVARSLYERMQREEQLRKFDKGKWYKCDLDAITDAHVRSSFVQSDCDDDTEAFLSHCYEKSDWFFTHVFHAVARTLLSLFMTSTSINGFLNRGSMFVFGRTQFSALVDDLPRIKADPNSKLLDLGAGDGKVTERMSSFFAETYATEISPVMRRLLTKKGFKVLDIDAWTEPGVEYDVIACLNLLDRCDKPVTMLHQMKSKLKPNGVILMALVFPFSQYVENSSNATHRATESVSLNGTTFEQHIVSLNEELIRPNGLEIVKWTRVPYLCEGDLDLSFYWLHDAVLVLKAVD